MYEYFDNPKKSFLIVRLNVVAYMLNCHDKGEVIRNTGMYGFTVLEDKYLYRAGQLHRVTKYLIKRGLIVRTIRGKYAVVDRVKLENELRSIMTVAGVFKVDTEIGDDELLDLWEPENPNEENFSINVLRHLINLHVQDAPIRATDFNRFTAHQGTIKGVYNGVRYVFKILYLYGAVKKSRTPGFYHITDLQFIKEMLCEKERRKGVPLSYPGLVRKVKLIEESKKKHVPVKTKHKKDELSPWYEPQKGWVSMLDSVMGNLKGVR